MLNFSDRLKEERKRLGLNQMDVATAVGVSKTTQFNYEKGERQPDTAYLSSAAELGMDINYLITGSRLLNCEVELKEELLKPESGSDFVTFQKQLGTLTEQFEALKRKHQVAEQPGNYGPLDKLPLKDLIGFNPVARDELVRAIRDVEMVLLEEGITLTPEQKAGAIVGVCCNQDVGESIKEMSLF